MDERDRETLKYIREELGDADLASQLKALMGEEECSAAVLLAEHFDIHPCIRCGDPVLPETNVDSGKGAIHEQCQ